MRNFINIAQGSRHSGKSGNSGKSQGKNRPSGKSGNLEEEKVKAFILSYFDKKIRKNPRISKENSKFSASARFARLGIKRNAKFINLHF